MSNETDAEATFLADIIANPEDDAPRLIFADWLSEHGQAVRADFIRRQIYLAALPPLPTAALVPGVVIGGVDGLLASRGFARSARWSARSGLFIAADIPHVELVYRRGFIDGITLPLALWKDWGPLLVRQHPLAEVRPGDKKPYLWDEYKKEQSERYNNYSHDGYEWLSSFNPRFYGRQDNTLPRWLAEQPEVEDEQFEDEEDAFAALSEACISWAWERKRWEGQKLAPQPRELKERRRARYFAAPLAEAKDE